MKKRLIKETELNNFKAGIEKLHDLEGVEQR